MNISTGTDGMAKLVAHQLKNSFMSDDGEIDELLRALPVALERTDRCLRACSNKYYSNADGLVTFNPFHSGQYSIFLYYLSRAVWSAGQQQLADKVYYLNKMLNCCDLFYEVDLPDVFFPSIRSGP